MCIFSIVAVVFNEGTHYFTRQMIVIIFMPRAQITVMQQSYLLTMQY